jgi:hypothetical protein
MPLEKRYFRKGAERVEREVDRYVSTVWKSRALRRQSRSIHRLAVPKPEQNEIVVKRYGHYELVDAAGASQIRAI